MFSAATRDRYRIVLALAVLCAGYSIYLLARTSVTYASLPFEELMFPALGDSVLTGSLPSFCHTFAFSLATAVLLRPWPRASVASVGVWSLVEITFEVAQVRSAVFTFDPVDLFAIMLGGMAAWKCAK